MLVVSGPLKVTSISKTCDLKSQFSRNAVSWGTSSLFSLLVTTFQHGMEQVQLPALR